MDPLTAAIAAAIVMYKAVVIVSIILLTFNEILNWFRSRNNLVASDRNNIAFTLQDMIGRGQYKTIQGVFNMRKSKVIDGRVVESKNIDGRLAQAHYDQRLVLYR